MICKLGVEDFFKKGLEYSRQFEEKEKLTIRLDNLKREEARRNWWRSLVTVDLLLKVPITFVYVILRFLILILNLAALVPLILAFFALIISINVCVIFVVVIAQGTCFLKMTPLHERMQCGIPDTDNIKDIEFAQRMSEIIYPAVYYILDGLPITNFCESDILKYSIRKIIN
jgi:hypothetical protein